MITYENQLRKFFKITQVVHISPQAQTLYFQLLSYFDSKFWPQSLKLDNITIYHSTELSRQALARARKELQKLALISYTPGAGSASGEYVIFDLAQKSMRDLIEDEKMLAKQPDAEIANLSYFHNEFEYLSSDDRFYAEYILQVLQKALKKQQTGVFNGQYATAQNFIQSRSEMTLPFIYKLVTTLKNKPDIQNKESYILASIQNFSKNKTI